MRSVVGDYAGRYVGHGATDEADGFAGAIDGLGEGDAGLGKPPPPSSCQRGPPKDASRLGRPTSLGDPRAFSWPASTTQPGGA
jgi:hypothetical protein